MILGAEKASDWVDEMMNLIVNTRYNERRLTIFTSNYPDMPTNTEPESLAGSSGRIIACVRACTRCATFES